MEYNHCSAAYTYAGALGVEDQQSLAHFETNHLADDHRCRENDEQMAESKAVRGAIVAENSVGTAADGGTAAAEIAAASHWHIQPLQESKDGGTVGVDRPQLTTKTLDVM